jgi:hypothetical protein
MVLRTLSGLRGSAWLLAPVIAGLLGAGAVPTSALAQAPPRFP